MKLGRWGERLEYDKEHVHISSIEKQKLGLPINTAYNGPTPESIIKRNHIVDIIRLGPISTAGIMGRLGDYPSGPVEKTILYHLNALKKQGRIKREGDPFKGGWVIKRP